MTDRTLPHRRGAGTLMADGVSFTGLVATLATTIILGFAFGVVVAGAW